MADTSATTECRGARFWRDGHVAVIELVNPPLNVVTVGMTYALDHLLRQVTDDPSIRAVVVTGDGDRAFCAGSDIGEFANYMAPGRVVERKLEFQNEVFDRLEALPLPTIAALNGLAFGGGLEIALCCDLIVAAPQTKLALPEIRLGVFPSSGGPVRLARRIGAARAKRLIFTGDPITADAAEALGLVTHLVTGRPLTEALALARRLAAGPRIGLAAAKDLINHADIADPPELRRKSLQYSDKAFSSAECAAGVSAFRAHTDPDFIAAAERSKATPAPQ